MSADLQLTPDGGLMLHVRLAAAVLGRHLLKPENGGELDSLHLVDLETGDCENLVNLLMLHYHGRKSSIPLWIRPPLVVGLLEGIMFVMERESRVAGRYLQCRSLRG